MEELLRKMENRLNLIRQNGSTKVEERQYECHLCKDTEYRVENNRVKPCQCQEVKKYKRILAASGISRGFQQRTFENFNTEYRPLPVKTAKSMAENYVQNYHQLRECQHNSIAFLGQVGSGKSHLSIAIANSLMKQNIGVLYMQYREAITALKQNIMDEVYYQREMKRYKTTKVLLIDDLYKGKISSTDHNIMFEIINYRYLNQLPIVLSSEYTVDALLEFDEAIGSRLIEMCKGRIIELEGLELNYRLGV